MGPTAGPLRFFGSTSELPALEWNDVRSRLVGAPTYWVDVAGGERPHPRPVWGVWLDRDALALSIGTPAARRRLTDGAAVSVHLDSGIDPVVVEGRLDGFDGEPAGEAIRAYDTKYDWSYDVDQYGPLAVVRPDAVLAWRSLGPAGRDGFGAASRFTFA
jgi:hypothetical protein